jgi:hypothetical protein
MKKRHAIKLALLIPSLIFLFWWGWSGNFAVNSGSLFHLIERDTFYRLDLGVKAVGWAKRVISRNTGQNSLTMSEETLLDLTLGQSSLRFRTDSETTFDTGGRLTQAVFSIPLGGSLAQAKAAVERERLVCELSFGDQSRRAEVPLPPAGPILVSGLVPWLSHQREIPLGRPLGLELLDPVSLTFKPAELVIEDVTEPSDELEVYKLTLRFMGAENVEWLDSEGKLLRQRNPGLDMDLFLLEGDDLITEAQLALSGSGPRTASTPGGAAGDFLSGFLSGDGLELLNSVLGPGGSSSPLANSPWLKPESSVNSEGEPSGNGTADPEPAAAGRWGPAVPGARDGAAD